MNVICRVHLDSEEGAFHTHITRFTWGWWNAYIQEHKFDRHDIHGAPQIWEIRYTECTLISITMCMPNSCLDTNMTLGVNLDAKQQILQIPKTVVGGMHAYGYKL